jgi:hypothetical protein
MPTRYHHKERRLAASMAGYTKSDLTAARQKIHRTITKLLEQE